MCVRCVADGKCNCQGIRVRKMDTQFDSAHSTTMVMLEGVRVPTRYLIGQEGVGFMYILENFNHE